MEGNTLQLFAYMNCAYIPFREDNVAEIYQGVSALLPAEFTKYKLQIRTNKRSIEELVPQVLRSKKDKKTKTFNPVASKPLVTEISAPNTHKNGLQNRHIALWLSHGWYYEPKQTSTPKATYCLSSCRCWKMPVPTCCFPANAIARRQKSS